MRSDQQQKRLDFVSLLEYGLLFSLPVVTITVAAMMWAPQIYSWYLEAFYSSQLPVP